MKSTGEAIYFIKDLKDPFFGQVYGERSMYLRAPLTSTDGTPVELMRSWCMFG